MAKEQKLTEKELESIEELKNANRQLTVEFGQIRISEKQLEQRKQQAEDMYNQVKEKEQELLNELRDKYEDGSIDLDKGVFIPKDEPQTQKQQPQNGKPKSGNVVQTAFD